MATTGSKEYYAVLEEFSQLIARLQAGESFILPDERQLLLDRLTEVLACLQETHEFDFREIGDHLYDGIYIADGQGKTMYVNKAYTRITGIQAQEVVGRYVAELMVDGLYRNAVTPEVIRTKKQVNAMAESLRNGIKMLITGNPIFDRAGNVKKVVVIDREMSDLLEMKAELDASQEKMKAVEEDKDKKKEEIEHLRRLHFSKTLIARSPEMEQVVAAIDQIARLDVTVLITGETGVGKEVVANAIRVNSAREKGPFVKVNCAAIPATLLEAELFGYEKGSFTGATSSGKMGMFELADKGTLLLDEIGEMSLELQAKLLRVIQHKEISRLGGTKPIQTDVRIISATHCDLKELVRQGKFREDLYYRLNVFPIYIPPLRERREDIGLLVRHFLSMCNSKYGKSVMIDESGLQTLQRYDWPGNVRELQNIVERLVIISESMVTISGPRIAGILNIEPFALGESEETMGLYAVVEETERRMIEKALRLGGSTRKAAALLKIDQSTIVKKAQKLGIITK